MANLFDQPHHLNGSPAGPVSDAEPAPADAEPVTFDPADVLTTGPSYFPDGKVMKPGCQAHNAGVSPNWTHLYRRRNDHLPATRGQHRQLMGRVADVERAVIEQDERAERAERAAASRRAAG